MGHVGHPGDRSLRGRDRGVDSGWRLGRALRKRAQHHVSVETDIFNIYTTQFEKKQQVCCNCIMLLPIKIYSFQLHLTHFTRFESI